MSIIQTLTEGVVQRNLRDEGAALVEKWESTGLLEGIVNDRARGAMSVLLENQAMQLLREASSMAAGDVEGYAAVAFPLVRRVFGNLIANELVSVQPMSLPSGLIFFLDFTHTDARLDYAADTSLYGQGRVASQITGGADLVGAEAEQGFYNLNNGYASPVTGTTGLTLTVIASGTAATSLAGTANTAVVADLAAFDKWLQFDPDLSGSAVVMASVAMANFSYFNNDNLPALAVTSAFVSGASTFQQVRRITQYDSSTSGSSTNFYVFFTATGTTEQDFLDLSASIGGRPDGNAPTHDFQWVAADNFQASNALGSVVGAAPWALESQATNVAGTFNWDVTGDIPEIDIKVDSISVSAITKKLKAKWTPELGQDLNAYHNLDAEVELTSILSEQIGLEIDREILTDLIKGATAGTLYWSRRPGKFLNRETGADVSSATAPPDFTGNVSMWYETLVETINDLSARMHRKLLRGGANFIVCSPEVASVLEMTAGFRANVTVDDTKGTVGTVKVGSLSRKWDIYVDPYFPRAMILVGRKGSSFLESGYVYAPYVPLQTTPTIFGTEDFVPRKGVMTRYAKKMVKPDHYGLVFVQDLLG